MKFSRYLLPKLDTMLTLEDESGNQHTAKYIVSKSGLSAGWRSFSVAHKLVEGDVLLFHLVEPVKFKVIGLVFLSFYVNYFFSKFFGLV